MMINLWAVLSATIAAYLAGAIWYSPYVLLRRWCKETGTPENSEIDNPIRTYGLTFLATLIGAVVLHLLLGPAPELKYAVLAGLMTGAGIVACSIGITYQFGRQSLTLWLIDGGFHCLRFTLIGLMLGLWPLL
ncbi:MAG: DUF1761 domain-containing protein [Marinobacterium sp.]|nr:DUF1761 domain-containing protein [Marinobacterium sp.]